MMREKSNITMPSEQMNGKLDGWEEKNREEEWQLSQIKLKEHAYEEKVERSCWKINNEMIYSSWTYENISKLRWNFATNEKQ